MSLLGLFYTSFRSKGVANKHTHRVAAREVLEMGAHVGRLFRNFNLEARAHREIGKSKPEAAPRHPVPFNHSSSVPPGNDDIKEYVRVY